MSNSANRVVTSGSRKVDPLIGTLVAERYRILEMVGRGGMGVVYKARHEMMERTVAIKMLLPQLLADENALPRFQREARAASRINHPNIIALHDFGLTDEDMPYLVMDYIEGESLADVLKREVQLGVSRCVQIFIQVCDALAHAHELGIIHRDLKPGNIMLLQKEDEKDIVKVVDFGVAKMYEATDDADAQRLTSTGELFGSPVYMSPEQCMGHELDARSDVYSLGCVMYETLTGKLPHVGKTVLETISKQMNGKPSPLSDARPDLYIPEWLETVVFRALEKDVARRPQNMRELQTELALGASRNSTPQTRVSSSRRMSAITPQQIAALSASQAAGNAQSSSRSWKTWAIAASAIIALLGGTAFAFSVLSKKPSGRTSPRMLPSIHHDVVQPSTENAEPQPVPPTVPAKTEIPKKQTTVAPTHTKPTFAQKPSAVPKVSHHEYTPISKNPPRVVESVAPPIRHLHTRKTDYYDITRSHDPKFGDAQELPVKPYGSD